MPHILSSVVPSPLDQNAMQFDPLLSNLQGNVLKGHGRDHTANIFVQFHPGQLAEVRKWIHQFAEEHVTSAKKQLAESARFKRNRVSGGLFAGLYITAAGLNYFEVPAASQPGDGSFLGGMANANLNDPPRSDWEPGFKDFDIHVMILLGDDDKTVLSTAAADIVNQLRPLTLDPALANPPFFSPFIRIEHGNAIRNNNGDGLEHFGYVDGVSQPLFFADEYAAFTSSATPSTTPLDWDPLANVSLVLIPDPLAPQNDDACGSYFVFRKLEQNVRGFKEAEQEVAKALLLNGDDRELAGALVVGRFEDGTPVTLSKTDGLIDSGAANNFNYNSDKDGMRCPFQAHIRKSNPRGTGGAETLEGEKAHIMARRGIPFGQREITPQIESQPEQFPTGGVGLLFQSFQASLGNQFEFIQNAWVNNAGFPFLAPPAHTGVDPVIGQSATPPDPNDRVYDWPTKYGDSAGGTTTAGFAQFVTMKGGEYFFAPSIDGLKAL